MIKQNVDKILYAISLLLFLVFIIMICIDYANYNTIENSAPFNAFIVIRLIEFIIPCVLLFIIGKIVKKKINKNSWC